MVRIGMLDRRFTVLVVVSALFYAPQPAFGGGPRPLAQARIVANDLFMTMTGGLPLQSGHPLYGQLVALAKTGKSADLLEGAYRILDPRTGEKSVYNNIANVWRAFGTRSGGLVAGTSITESMAMLAGSTRDRLPFTSLLYDPETYRDPNVLPGPLHYDEVAKTKVIADVLRRTNREGGHVGVFTAYDVAESFFSAGTNRRVNYFILERLYCLRGTEMINFSIPDIYVAGDVPRNPGNKPDEYMRNCKGCHAGNLFLDASLPLLTRYDFVAPDLLIQEPKNKFNEFNFPAARDPAKATMATLMFTPQQRELLGLGEVSGTVYQKLNGLDIYYVELRTLADLGRFIADSKRLYYCQAMQMLTSLYLKTVFSFATLTPEQMALLDENGKVIDAFGKMLMKTNDYAAVYAAMSAFVVEAQE